MQTIQELHERIDELARERDEAKAMAKDACREVRIQLEHVRMLENELKEIKQGLRKETERLRKGSWL